MYVNPFVAGIAVTIAVELLFVVLGALVSIWRDKRRNKRK